MRVLKDLGTAPMIPRQLREPARSCRPQGPTACSPWLHLRSLPTSQSLLHAERDWLLDVPSGSGCLWIPYRSSRERSRAPARESWTRGFRVTDVPTVTTRDSSHDAQCSISARVVSE